jgi:hypothetical protein
MKTAAFYKSIFQENVVFYNEKEKNCFAAVYLFLLKLQIFIHYKQRLFIQQCPLYGMQRPLYVPTMPFVQDAKLFVWDAMSIVPGAKPVVRDAKPVV